MSLFKVEEFVDDASFPATCSSRATAVACLPTKDYFEKEINLIKKNTGKPSQQVDCQCSYAKIFKHKGVLENETDATQKTDKNHSHLVDCTYPFNMIAF